MSISVHPAFRGFHAAPARSAAQRPFRGFRTLSDALLEPATTLTATSGCDVPGCHAPDHRVRAAV